MSAVTLEPTPRAESASGRLVLSTPRPTPLRVAFVGQAGAGKSTQARLLQQKYKGDVLSFASPLKKLTADLFGEYMLDPQFARTANQEVGVLARRLAGPDIWVKKLVAKVSPDRNCYVDDCRFFSEYYALKDLSFIIVKLVADPATLQARRPRMTQEQWQHESERDSAFLYSDVFVDTSRTSEQETHQAIVNALGAMHTNFLR